MEVRHCSVCGMDAKDSTICAEYFGITHHFCTLQCHDNFLAHPKLYIGKQAPVNIGRKLIKQRSFLLDEPMRDEQRDPLIALLHTLMSVQDVCIEGNRVSIAYNLLEIHAAQIEAALEQAGASMSSSWAERLKRGWVHYIEDNELDHLARGDMACCNKPPAKG